MTIAISGNGTITGIAANGLPSGVITTAQLATSLDLSSKTLTLPGNTRTTTTETIDNSKEIIDNPTTGGVYEQRRILRVATSGEELLQQKLVYSFRQSANDYWIKILTPQAYADGRAGGTATFKLSYLTVHAAGSAYKSWRAVFGNNHGQEFAWAVSSMESLKVSDSYYGWTPTLTHWRNSGSGSSAMREYYLKFNGYPGGYSYIDVVLEIDGVTGSGEWPFAITDLGTTAPSPISQLTVS